MKTKKAGIWILMTVLMLSLLAGCSKSDQEPLSTSGGRKTKAAQGKDNPDGESTKKKRSGNEDLAGRYEAIKVILLETGEEAYRAEGEYLLLNEDGSVQVFFSADGKEELTETDATYDNGKIYIDGDTQAGELNEDGTILLYVNDEFNMLFAREGQPGYEEWLEYTAWVAEQYRFGYDFTEAKKFIGDWIGWIDIGFTTSQGEIVRGLEYGEWGETCFARIVIDEEGSPQVYFRTIMPDWANFRKTEAEFDEDGALIVKGQIADGDWVDAIIPPADGEDMIEVRGYTDLSGEEELFRMYLKPIDATWSRDDIPNLTDERFRVLGNNVKNLGAGGDMESTLANVQAFLDGDLNARLVERDQINMFPEWLPDPSLLTLYAEEGTSSSGGTGKSSGGTKASSDVIEGEGYTARVLKLDFEENWSGDGCVFKTIIEIENTGSKNISLPSAELDFMDKDGNLIVTEEYMSCCPSLLKPGEKGYLYDSYGRELDGVTDVNGITMIPRIIETFSSEFNEYEVSDLSLGEEVYGVVLSGNITNQTDSDASFLSVDVVFYDKQGDVIAIDAAFPGNMTPGETVSFQTSGNNMPDGVTLDMIGDYKVFARDYLW